MRKIVCTVLIFILVCSPAQAFEDSASVISTAAAVQFDALVQDDSGIMALDNINGVDSITMSLLSYNSLSDTTSVVSSKTITRLYGEQVTNQTISNPGAFIQPDSQYFGIRVTVVPDSALSPGNLRTTLHYLQANLCCVVDSVPGYWYTLSPDLFSPVSSFCKLKWSGTGKYTPDNGAAPSWVSIKGTFTTVATSSADNYLLATGLSPSYLNRPMSDLTFDVNMELPKTATVNGSVYSVVSGSFSEVEYTFIFRISPSALRYGSAPYNFSYPHNFVTLGRSSGGNLFELRLTNIGNQPAFYLVHTQNGSSTFSSGFSGLQQSIGSLTQNVTKQINEVKTTMQQGANEIKNEIKSQTQTITDKLTAVKDDIVGGITDLKETTTQGFKDVVQGITDLPGKIGEMLQGLIVPDSEKVSGKFEDFNNLAEEKLGVIYQVPEMVISMGQSIVSGAVEQKGEMTLPKFEIIMPATTQSRSGETLTVWEEYTFPIWPEGTEVIHTAVQTATSLICVIAMINSIKRKYEEWLDGH